MLDQCYEYVFTNSEYCYRVSKHCFNELQVATTSDSVVAFVSLSIREVYFST